MNTATPILVKPVVANCSSIFPVSFLLPQVLRQRVRCMFNIQAKHILRDPAPLKSLEFCYLLQWKCD